MNTVKRPNLGTFQTRIKPTKVEARTIEGIRSKVGRIGGFGTKFCSYGSNVMVKESVKNDLMKTYVYAYNLEKRRPIKKRIGKTYDTDKGTVTCTKVVEQGKWIAHVYRIPAALLVLNKQKVQQKSRFFRIVDA